MSTRIRNLLVKTFSLLKLFPKAKGFSFGQKKQGSLALKIIKEKRIGTKNRILIEEMKDKVKKLIKEKIAKDRKVIPDPIDDRKFQE